MKCCIEGCEAEAFFSFEAADKDTTGVCAFHASTQDPVVTDPETGEKRTYGGSLLARAFAMALRLNSEPKDDPEAGPIGGFP